jgi:threonine dehydrogenase-like Zn-dependent dehydrogenase
VKRSRAVVLREFGAQLDLAEFEVPEPGPGAAVVAVELGGICGTDAHLQRGHLPMPLPVVLGHEAVGRVIGLGDGLDRDVLGQPIAPGDLVTWASSIACGRCHWCLREQEPTLCADRAVYGINRRADRWPHLSGAWADAIYLHPGTTLVAVPDGLEPVDVIALGCAGPTAVHGVLRLAAPGFGDTVVVQGSGPVGLAAAIYAGRSGAGRVVLVGGPAGRLELARELGIADVCLDIFEVEDPATRARLVLAETPGGRGADLVVECTGSPPAVAQGIDLCRPNGTYLILGQYTDRGPTPLNPHLITRKQLRVLGSWAFSGGHFVDYVESLPRLVERFELHRLVSTYPLESAGQALDDVRAGRVVKAALRPSRSALV